MAGRVAFGEKTKYLFRQREGTIMGIAIGGQNFHIIVKSSESREMGARRDVEGLGSAFAPFCGNRDSSQRAYIHTCFFAPGERAGF